jgi:hypothetical protein
MHKIVVAALILAINANTKQLGGVQDPGVRNDRGPRSGRPNSGPNKTLLKLVPRQAIPTRRSRVERPWTNDEPMFGAGPCEIAQPNSAADRTGAPSNGTGGNGGAGSAGLTSQTWGGVFFLLGVRRG